MMPKPTNANSTVKNGGYRLKPGYSLHRVGDDSWYLLNDQGIMRHWWSAPSQEELTTLILEMELTR